MVIMPPITTGDTPMVCWLMVEIALACTVEPMPKVAIAVKKAKATAISFQNQRAMPRCVLAKPFSMAYMGPPSMRPSELTRYFTAKRPSAYLVDMPKTPVIQHQNTAPGPPKAMAVPTPTMFPVPIVAAKAVANAPNCDTSPSASLSLLNDSLMAFRMWRWGKRKRMVRKMWVPNKSIIVGRPQTHELISPTILFSVSIH